MQHDDFEMPFMHGTHIVDSSSDDVVALISDLTTLRDKRVTRLMQE